MRRYSYLGVGVLCFVLCCSAAQGAQVPISVYPNPIQFGAVPINSTSGFLSVWISNVIANPVVVTAIGVSGANSTDFAFASAPCTGSISGGQSCQMYMTFTPGAMGDRSANLTVTFKGTGSPVTIPLLGSGGNPIPNITSTSPASVYVGSPGFTLTINGTGFLPLSTASVNSTQLSTTYVSGTQITAAIPASYLTNTGTLSINVTNPAPGGGAAYWGNFQIIGKDPAINNLAPSSLVAGAGSTSLIVNGGNFMTGATVLWNGKSRPTTYVNSSQLQAQLTVADLAKPEIAQVSVSNPSPGGVSGTSTFNVTYPATVKVVNIPANDLVWDPYMQRIYASVPSSFGAKGNTVAVINPTTGAVTNYYFAGSEPTMLALSDDARYLYAGLNGAGSVQRLILPGFKPDINVSLGNGQFGGVNTAGDVKVSPGDSHTFAVTLNGGCCGGGTVEFFTDNTQLPNSVNFPGVSVMQFADANTVYGYASNTLSQIAVDNNGGTLSQQWGSVLTCNGDIHYQQGLVYGPGGEVFNPQTGALAGSYDVPCGQNNLLPDGPVNRTFFLGNTQFNSQLVLTAYNLSHFTPIAGIDTSQFIGTASSLIHWGKNGLAFIVQNNQCCNNPTAQVVLIQSAMVLPPSTTKNPVPVAKMLSPGSATHGSGNVKVVLTGSGFVAGSRVTWNGGQLYTDYVSSTQMTIYVPWSDLKTAGSVNVVVSSPTPGGGTSSAITFTIN